MTDDLTSAAKALGKKGGEQRAANLSAQELSDQGRRAALIRHHPELYAGLAKRHESRKTPLRPKPKRKPKK